MARPFRFGVNLVTPESGDGWRAKCRRAEALGYDVLLVPDHLGTFAPFPALVAAAEATERPRVGTFVLNAGFWNPALLAREVATCDRLAPRDSSWTQKLTSDGAAPRRSTSPYNRLTHPAGVEPACW